MSDDLTSERAALYQLVVDAGRRLGSVRGRKVTYAIVDGLVDAILNAGFCCAPQLRAELARVMVERDEWKANHDNQVAIKRAALVRADLPIPEHPERTEFRRTMRRLEDERDEAMAAANILRGALENVVREIKAWPSIHPDGDYLHGWVLGQAESALKRAP